MFINFILSVFGIFFTLITNKIYVNNSVRQKVGVFSCMFGVCLEQFWICWIKPYVHECITAVYSLQDVQTLNMAPLDSSGSYYTSVNLLFHTETCREFFCQVYLWHASGDTVLQRYSPVEALLLWNTIWQHMVCRHYIEY